MCQKYQIDLSLTEPKAVDDSMDNQIRRQSERLSKASDNVAENHKALIEEEKLGRSSQDSESKQLREYTLVKQ